MVLSLKGAPRRGTTAGGEEVVATSYSIGVNKKARHRAGPSCRRTEVFLFQRNRHGAAAEEILDVEAIADAGAHKPGIEVELAGHGCAPDDGRTTDGPRRAEPGLLHVGVEVPAATQLHVDVKKTWLST